MNIALRDPWKEFSTVDQRRLFNAACGDLAKGFVWYGNRLSKDDWRHFLSGTVLKFRLIPGIPMGEGNPGFITLGGSSLELKKPQCTEAITLAFALGDAPWEYDPSQKVPVAWCDVVVLARGGRIGETFARAA